MQDGEAAAVNGGVWLDLHNNQRRPTNAKNPSQSVSVFSKSSTNRFVVLKVEQSRCVKMDTVSWYTVGRSSMLQCTTAGGVCQGLYLLWNEVLSPRVPLCGSP